jgi:Spy/CpxP family protein refolding chaperone
MAVCSVAIAAGVLGAVALAKMFFFRRRMMMMGYGSLGYEGGGCGHRGFGRWGGFRGGWGGRFSGPGGSFWLRALFARLDTTPGQEREIRSAIEELRERARDAKSSMKESRDGLGRAIAGETFDESAFESVSARFDATSEKMKDAFGSALKRIHGVLDPKQRERLAELVSKGMFGRGGRGGWGGGGWGGPYRESAEI